MPPIFETIGRLAGIGGAELRQTFNCGIGFAVVLEEAAVDAAINLLAEHGIDAWHIGEVRADRRTRRPQIRRGRLI